MSEEQLKAFKKKIKNDSKLQDKIKATTDPSAIAEIAKELGFLISLSDLADGLGIDELDGVEWGID
ncbi:nif11-like leader peptide domain protein [Synechococcus sp. BIOS-E4-1]|uniref:Nif11-like leader peptide family RiPP precursor n=1 Tax=Synechococcus sp. BIOS-E4-1 TaxID=1400864 RepID=UPI001648EEDF|nr:Nif11-like leader peptide family RiPP precursor [Synechococcus sp. BIOS-E4-1]QNI56200.1 nif11-like leader peptide domain protein [Synechococcus sp. BIOS-E4-1]